MMAVLPNLKKAANPGASSDPVEEIKKRLIANFMALAEEAYTLGVFSRQHYGGDGHRHCS